MANPPCVKPSLPARTAQSHTPLALRAREPRLSTAEIRSPAHAAEVARRECKSRSNPLRIARWRSSGPDSRTKAHHLHRETSGSRSPSVCTFMAQPATRSVRTGAGDPAPNSSVKTLQAGTSHAVYGLILHQYGRCPDNYSGIGSFRCRTYFHRALPAIGVGLNGSAFAFRGRCRCLQSPVPASGDYLSRWTVRPV